MFDVKTVEKLDSEKQESIRVGCALPAWKPMCFSFSGHHQMSLGGPKWTSLNRSPVMTTRCHLQGWAGGGRDPRSDVQGVGAQYSEVQYIMGNSHIHGTPPRPHDRIMDGRTQLRTLLPVTSYFLEIMDPLIYLLIVIFTKLWFSGPFSHHTLSPNPIHGHFSVPYV